MDYVYVVVSSDKDTYLEQTILSIESLKRAVDTHNVYVIIDPETRASLTGRRAKLYDVADHVLVVSPPAAYNAQQRSRYLKTTMYSHLEHDFIYIDGDTLICDDPSTAAGDYPVAAVLDRHALVSEHPRAKRLAGRAKRCGFNTSYQGKHFNGGFMYVKKCPESERFFRLWEDLRGESLARKVSQDQASLNEANYRMGGVIHELDGTYNCQIGDMAGLRFLPTAIVIHYFASGGTRIPFNLAEDKIIRHVTDDTYPEGLLAVLNAPRATFMFIKHYIAESSTGEVAASHTFRLVFELVTSRKAAARWLYCLMECLSLMTLTLRRWTKLCRRAVNRKRS